MLEAATKNDTKQNADVDNKLLHSAVAADEVASLRHQLKLTEKELQEAKNLASELLLENNMLRGMQPVKH